MITMTEIAKLTGVSQPTVSRVLNGNPNVGQEIRERVLACAKEHNYQCNALAKGLQGSKTMLLGVLVTDISNGFFADLAKAIEASPLTRFFSMHMKRITTGMMAKMEAAKRYCHSIML